MGLLVLITALVLLPVASVGTTRTVPGEYASIQSALNACVGHDTVLVGPGTYHENLVAPVTVTIIGADGAVSTIIDGSERDRVLEGFTMHLIGLTIRAGKVFAIGGGGVLGNGTITDCIFENNGTAPYNNLRGGAVYGSFTITRSCFYSNGARESGGAIYGSSTAIECEFIGNVAENGGAVDGVTCIDCYFETNVSRQKGAAAYRSPNLTRCWFQQNRGYGGVVRDCRFIRHCIFYSNANASAIYQASNIIGSSTIENCTFVGNQIALTTTDNHAATVNASIFYDNANPFAGSGSSSSSLNCSVMWANGDDPPTGTNREIDPLFCNLETADFTLNNLSPCLPENSEGCGLVGALDQGCGPVPVRRLTIGEMKALFLERNP